MESFSTAHRGALPFTANVLTLAALVATMWWSAENRPQPGQKPEAASAAAITVAQPSIPSNSRASLIAATDNGPRSLPSGAMVTATSLGAGPQAIQPAAFVTASQR